MNEKFIHPTSEISPSAVIGEGTSIWNGTKIREDVIIGRNVKIGQNVYIGPGIIIGDDCKIQNQAQVFEEVILEQGVFIGPGTLITNDINPRSINPDYKIKVSSDWQKTKKILKRGCSLGAGSIVVGNLVIGEWALVGAGSVVTKSVRSFSLSYGIPAEHKNWVCKCGFKLVQISNIEFQCDTCENKFTQLHDELFTNL